MDEHPVVCELKVDLAALDDVNVHRFIAFAEHNPARFESPQFQSLEDRRKLGVRDSSEDPQFRNDRRYGTEVFQGGDSTHGRR